MNLNDIEKHKISEIITRAEKKTSSEFVVATLKESDHYPAAHYRLALFFATILTTLTYLFSDFDLTIDPIVLLWSLVAGLILGYTLGFLPFFKRVMSTQRELNEESYQKAVELFHQHKITETKNRTGILIFFTLLERKVYILADSGINQKCEQSFWDTHIKTLTTGIKEKRIVESIEKVIAEIADLLEKHFPYQENDENELSNEVVSE